MDSFLIPDRLLLSINLFPGKICSAGARDLINDEEELDALSDAKSVDMFGQSSNWLRNVVRRNTQVAPEGKFSLLTIKYRN